MSNNAAQPPLPEFGPRIPIRPGARRSFRILDPYEPFRRKPASGGLPNWADVSQRRDYDLEREPVPGPTERSAEPPSPEGTGIAALALEAEGHHKQRPKHVSEWAKELKR